MDKDVHPYKQRKDTCAIACMLMVLEYYKVIEKANWYDEKRYYRLYGSKYVVGTPFSALAYHFSKNGLLLSRNLYCTLIDWNLVRLMYYRPFYSCKYHMYMHNQLFWKLLLKYIQFHIAKYHRFHLF